MKPIRLFGFTLSRDKDQPPPRNNRIAIVVRNADRMLALRALIEPDLRPFVQVINAGRVLSFANSIAPVVIIAGDVDLNADVSGEGSLIKILRARNRIHHDSGAVLPL